MVGAATPKPFGSWGSVELPPDVELHVEVVRLHDGVIGRLAGIGAARVQHQVTWRVRLHRRGIVLC